MRPFEKIPMVDVVPKNKNRIIYRLSVWWQSLLWRFGIAWHNTYMDECTPDFNCCEPIGRFAIFKWNKYTTKYEKLMFFIGLALMLMLLSLLGAAIYLFIKLLILISQL